MGYNLAKGFLNCWACGGKTLPAVLSAKLEIPFRKALELTKGMEIVKFAKEDKPKNQKLILPKGLGPLLPAHQKYLRDERQLNIAEMESIWKLQGIGPNSKFPWRIFIPIEFEGLVVSWTTRGITNKSRYRSAGENQEILPAKSLLFGEDLAQSTVIICEGPFDVFRIGPGAVCTVGTAFTRSQVLKASKYPFRYVCFDNSPDAQESAEKLCRQLEVFPGNTWNIRLDSKDPGEATDKEIRTLRKLLK
jgi:hypothetical protein